MSLQNRLPRVRSFCFAYAALHVLNGLVYDRMDYDPFMTQFFVIFTPQYTQVESVTSLDVRLRTACLTSRAVLMRQVKRVLLCRKAVLPLISKQWARALRSRSHAWKAVSFNCNAMIQVTTS